MSVEFYGPLDPRGWSRRTSNPIRLGGNLVNPATALQRAIAINQYEVGRARDQVAAAGAKPYDNIYDAEKHARASYRTAKDVGPGWAWALGWLNEAGGMARGGANAVREALSGGNPLEPLRAELRASEMDVNNNAVGRREAAANRPIPSRQTAGLRTLR
jgi:hypothetical protein